MACLRHQEAIAGRLVGKGIPKRNLQPAPRWIEGCWEGYKHREALERNQATKYRKAIQKEVKRKGKHPSLMVNKQSRSCRLSYRQRPQCSQASQCIPVLLSLSLMVCSSMGLQVPTLMMKKPRVRLTTSFAMCCSRHMGKAWEVTRSMSKRHCNTLPVLRALQELQVLMAPPVVLWVQAKYSSPRP